MPLTSIHKNFSLNQGETIVKTVRQAKPFLATALFLPSLLILLDFFLIYPLSAWGKNGIIVFFSVLIFSVLIFARTVIIWQKKIFIVTNQRLIDIDQTGLFKKTVSEVPLFKIQDVFFQVNGLIQAWLNSGDLSIAINDQKFRIGVKNIASPQIIQQLVLRLRSSFGLKSQLPNQLSVQESADLIKEIKTKLGGEKFNEVLEQIADDNIDNHREI